MVYWRAMQSTCHECDTQFLSGGLNCPYRAALQTRWSKMVTPVSKPCKDVCRCVNEALYEQENQTTFISQRLYTYTNTFVGIILLHYKFYTHTVPLTCDILALAVSVSASHFFKRWRSNLQIACHIVTALLHLFFMASFSWMLVEGLLLWSKVVSVNISEDSRMKLYYIIGWGNIAFFFFIKYVKYALLPPGKKQIFLLQQYKLYCWRRKGK